MDIQWTLNCYLELKLFLVIQLVPQKLNYAKVPYLYWLCFIEVYIQNTWQSREKESHTPVLWNSNADTSTPAWHSATGGGWVIICIAYMLCGIESLVCQHSLLHSVQIHSPCPGCCILLLTHFHILCDRQHRKIWPRENQVTDRVLLEFHRRGSSQFWAAVFVNLFLQYRRSSKKVLAVGDTLICNMILWSVLQKGLLFSVATFPAHCHSDDRLAGKLSQTLGTLTNSNWLCNRSRQHVQC